MESALLGAARETPVLGSSQTQKIDQYWKGNVMKRILAVIVFFAAATSLALGQTTDKPKKTKGKKADVEQILLQMERDGNEATVKKDVATLSELLADDWIGQSPDGIQTKAQAMADFKSEDQKFDAITLGDMKCGFSETQLS